MRPLVALIVILLMSLPGRPRADEIQLNGGEISRVLTGVTTVAERPDGHEIRQTFYASGRTLYVDVEPSWGRWEVRDDLYCSQWPPQQGWVCYHVAVWQRDGADWIVWTGESGTRYEARLLR